MLVVHPFAATIRAQYQKRGELFTNAPGGVNTLPELGADGIRKGVYHQHMLSGQCGAPGVGIIIWFQRAQLGKAGAVAAVDYLPLGPHIPPRQQVRPLSA